APSRASPRHRPRCRSGSRSRRTAMDLGSHGGFILAAYAFTALVMVALVGNALRDRRAQRRALKGFGEDRR
ncbi:heme exporter protein CcmD, partial [Roseovarius mucosus]|nr:heme exporter protein CcmD [Roseovarius mucosus]